MATSLKSLSLLVLITITTPTIARRSRGCRSCPTTTTVSTQPSFTPVPVAPSYAPVQQKSTVPARQRRSSGNVIELRSDLDQAAAEAQLSSIIQQNPNTMIYFYGTHCEPCHWMRPYLDTVMPEYPHVKFVTINVDEHPLIRLKYEIKGWPSLVPFKNGTQIIPVQDPKQNNEQYAYFSGPRDENQIRDVLNTIYKK